MGWITLGLEQVSVQNRINDVQLEKLQLTHEMNRLSKFASGISSGTISAAAIGAVGTGLFGEAMDTMLSADEAASLMAQQNAATYMDVYGSLSSSEYAQTGQANSLYINSETGELDEDVIYQNMYEEYLKEYIEENITPLLTEMENEMETKKTELETEETYLTAELESIEESIDQQIQSSVPKFA